MADYKQLRREIKVLRCALGTEKTEYYKRKAEECYQLLSEYDGLMEEATKGMSVEEKTRFQHDLAKQTAKDYAEGRTWQNLKL